jgi:hypothetical protein
VANRLYTWHEPEKIAKVFKPHLFEAYEDDHGNKIDPEPRELVKKKYEPIMFLGFMGMRRLWYRALCGMCNRKKYWNAYKGTLDKVEKDMKRQMDIVQLIRRLRAHGFALSMMYEKETLRAISKKAKGVPFESDPEPEKYMSSDGNLWGTHEMFSKDEKKKIAEQNIDVAEATDRNTRAMAQLKAGHTLDDSAADGVNKEIGGLVTGKLPPVGKIEGWEN